MARLSGWVWMIAGLIIMGYTKLIEHLKPTSKIGWFFWIGLVFVLFGAIKEFMPRLRSAPKRKEAVGPPIENTQGSHNQQQRLHPAMPHQGQSPYATHQHVQPHPHPSHPYSPAVKLCPRCHRHVPSHARSCYNCGFAFF